MSNFDQMSLAAQEQSEQLGVSVDKQKADMHYKPGPFFTKATAQKIVGLTKHEIEKMMTELESEGFEFNRVNSRYELTVEDLVKLFEKKGLPKHRDDFSKAIVAFVLNLKGGAGKSVATVNLAQGLRVAPELISKDLRVLVIDLDPQGTATMLMKHSLLQDKPDFTAAQLALNPDCDADDVLGQIHSTDIPNVSILPASINDAFIASDWMDTCQEEDLAKYAPYDLLKIMIEKIASFYDVILIDTGPHLDAFLLNSLVASDILAVPCPPTQVDLKSTLTFIERLPVLQEKIKNKGSTVDIKDTVAFMTKYDKQQGSHQSSKNIMKKVIKNTLRSVIPISVAFDKTALTFDTVLTMQPKDFDGARSTIAAAKSAVFEFSDEFYDAAVTAMSE
jgi:cellulose biosynthesis protein BcsQ